MSNSFIPTNKQEVDASSEDKRATAADIIHKSLMTSESPSWNQVSGESVLLSISDVKQETTLSYTDDDEMPFICGICGFHSPDEEILMAHLRNLHGLTTGAAQDGDGSESEEEISLEMEVDDSIGDPDFDLSEVDDGIGDPDFDLSKEDCETDDDVEDDELLSGTESDNRSVISHVCPSGNKNGNDSVTSHVCPSGKKNGNDSVTSQVCPSATESGNDSVNSNVHDVCQSGTESGSGSVSSNVCPPDTESGSGSVNSQACPLGTESGNGIVNSHVCPSGTESELPQLNIDQELKIQLSNYNSEGNLGCKRHACAFCKKLFTNIARHLKNKHYSEPEVAKIFLLPKRSKERRGVWQELVNRGDYSHNTQVMDKGSGIIIPKYRSKKGQEVNKFTFCESCKALYKKPDLEKHQKDCTVSETTTPLVSTVPTSTTLSASTARHTQEGTTTATQPQLTTATKPAMTATVSSVTRTTEPLTCTSTEPPIAITEQPTMTMEPQATTTEQCTTATEPPAITATEPSTMTPDPQTTTTEPPTTTTTTVEASTTGPLTTIHAEMEIYDDSIGDTDFHLSEDDCENDDIHDDELLSGTESDDSVVSHVYPQLSLHQKVRIQPPLTSGSDSGNGSVNDQLYPQLSLHLQPSCIYSSESGSVNKLVSSQQTVDQELKIQPSGSKSKGSLVSKRHACAFCKKLLTKIARHLTNKHFSEPEVAIALLLPKRSKERREAWFELVNRGDYLHNYHVMDKGSGMIIPKYRSKEDQHVKNFTFCECCKALYKKNELWKHRKTCTGLTFTVLQARHVLAGNLLMPPKQATRKLHENVLVKMRDDEVKSAVQTDRVILHFGNSMYNEKGHKARYHCHISSKMRELGQLLLSAKEINPEINCLTELMKASNWNLLILAVKKAAEYDDHHHQFGKPFLARQLGHSMKRCAELEHSEAVKVDNKEVCQLTETFIKMYELDWRKYIGSEAYSTLVERKYNKPQLLPLVEDVVKLSKALEEKVDSLCADIEKNPQECYPELAKTCLAQVTLFNSNRSEEAERMPVKVFMEAKVVGNVDEAVKTSLTVFEQNLCKTHYKVDIKGTNGKRVPVLLTEKMVSSLHLLLKYREAGGVEDEELLFSRPGSADFPYRGCDVLREFARGITLKRPDVVMSSKLRKQLATLAQISDLKDSEQDILATFQRHDIRVPRQLYHPSESVLQVAKIFKLLHRINKGPVDKYKGCDFNDIAVKNEELVDARTDESDEENEESDYTDVDTDEEIDDDVGMEVDAAVSKRKKIRKKTPRKGKARHTWTQSERTAIEEQFPQCLATLKVPTKSDCDNAKRKAKILSKYSWRSLKYAVYNMITQRKRKLWKNNL